MLPAEAQAIEAWVADLRLAPGTVCLNLGSSTSEFRSVQQPHVGRLMTALERQGLRIVHCDLKAEAGVDEAGDLLDPTYRERLIGYRAGLLLCSNLLEHLTDPRPFAKAAGDLVAAGGYGLFTVPRSFPYHPDPIDTYFRPTPKDLASLLPGWEQVRAEELQAGRLRLGAKEATRLAARVALPFYRPDQWYSKAHQLLWLFRPFVQTMVLLRKPLAR